MGLLYAVHRMVHLSTGRWLLLAYHQDQKKVQVQSLEISSHQFHVLDGPARACLLVPPEAFMNLAQAQEVYDVLHGQWPDPRSVIRFFARNRKTDAVYGQACETPDSLMGAANWAQSAGYDCYVQLNPTLRKHGTRVTASDITHWSWFLIDIDPVGENPKPLLAAGELYFLLLSYFGLKDISFEIVSSGRGIQLWYPLLPRDIRAYVSIRTEPLDMYADAPTEQGIITRKISEAAPRAMAHWLSFFRRKLEDQGKAFDCVIDTCASDLPRVMRCPYTINTRTGEMAHFIAHALHGPNVSLMEKLIAYAPRELWNEAPEAKRMEGATDATPWQQFIPNLTRGARIFLTEGGQEGGRHRSAAAALLSLKESGASANATREALLWGAKLCLPPLDPREIEPMIKRHWPHG